ncbi:hypothetical protein MYAM1_002283 [Malassezia yamatoensis]|uniref:J domain-containing protein n=1 Tax=Malassezia yamatoensis TaxID=253288 RepID=A0AAJ6CI68_9BASI|nr:hypothetical protein MYAM1_002283 [Malassezia yamatoensis]
MDSCYFPSLPPKPDLPALRDGAQNTHAFSVESLNKICDAFEKREEALSLRIAALQFRSQACLDALSSQGTHMEQLDDASLMSDTDPILGIRLLQRLDLLQRENTELGKKLEEIITTCEPDQVRQQQKELEESANEKAYTDAYSMLARSSAHYSFDIPAEQNGDALVDAPYYPDFSKFMKSGSEQCVASTSEVPLELEDDTRLEHASQMWKRSATDFSMDVESDHGIINSITSMALQGIKLQKGDTAESIYQQIATQYPVVPFKTDFSKDVSVKDRDEKRSKASLKRDHFCSKPSSSLKRRSDLQAGVSGRRSYMHAANPNLRLVPCQQACLHSLTRRWFQSTAFRMASHATPYDLLHIPKTATAVEVKFAFYDRAKTLHPDRVAVDCKTEGERESRTEEFRQVVQAYELLKDPKTRAMYDRYGMGWGNTHATTSYENHRMNPWAQRNRPANPSEWEQWHMWSEVLRRAPRGHRASWQYAAGASFSSDQFYGHPSMSKEEAAKRQKENLSMNRQLFGVIFMVAWIIGILQIQRLNSIGMEQVEAANRQSAQAGKNLEAARQTARSLEGQLRQRALMERVRQAKQARAESTTLALPDVPSM